MFRKLFLVMLMLMNGDRRASLEPKVITAIFNPIILEQNQN